MGSAPVTKSGTVCLRGIHFPVENIRAAMIETGGKPVSDPELNDVLDEVVVAHRASGGKEPEALAVDAIPGMWFIPVKVNLFARPGLIPSGGLIYFAVQRKTIFNA